MKEWQSSTTERGVGFGFGGAGFGGTCFSGFQQFGGGFGISKADNSASTINSTSLTQNLGHGVPVAGVIDGTSNTIIAILIGQR